MTKKKLIKKTVKKAAKKAIKLTKEEAKRVIILKDALSQLRIEAFQASTGKYVDFSLDDEIREIDDKKDKKELKDFLPKLVTKNKPCEVCAKGAIFLSGIRKFNNFSVGEAKSCNLDDIAGTKACDLVGQDNADRMEVYFELWSDEYDDTNELVYKWEEKYPDAADRLIGILRNAIRYKGTFSPEKEKF